MHQVVLFALAGKKISLLKVCNRWNDKNISSFRLLEKRLFGITSVCLSGVTGISYLPPTQNGHLLHIVVN